MRLGERKKYMTSRVTVICTVGFILAALLIVADEIFDIPAHVFNAPPTPINWTEIGIEAIFILIVGTLTIFIIQRLSLKRVQAERRTLYLHKILLTIRKINQLIMELDDESELLQKACATLVDGRNYKMAWIGFTSDGSYDILPIAQAGFENGYLSSVKITWDDSEYGNGPTGTAIRTRRPSVMRDIVNDEQYWPWREEALKRGYISSAALPLVVEDKSIGALSVYSAESDVFGDDEIGMLAELAGDISLGIERIRQRAKLRQSEERYRDLFDNANDLIQSVMPDGHFRYVNKKWREVLGYSDEDIASLTLWDIIHPDFISHCREAFQKVMAGEAVSNMEAVFVAKDGRLVAVEGNSNCRFEDGKPVGTRGIYRDITEHRNMEEELRIAEGNFRNSIEQSPLGIRIVTTEGDLLYANKAILDILGYDSVEELKATPISKLYSHGTYAQHVERRENRKLGEAMPSSYEVSIVRKDGQIRHLVASRKSVAWNGEAQFQVIYQDITERKEATEKIRQAAEEWRTTFDSITDLVSIHDKDFRLVRVNKAFANALNMKPKELVGKTCYQVIHGTTEPVPNCPHKATIETGEPATGEFFEPHLGIHLEVTTSPIFNEKGEVVASVHVARDITERKKMQVQLIVTDRLASVGELASGIAHELNNPLTSIIGFSDLLLERDMPGDVKEDLTVINREAKRTAQVVKNLLTFARKHPVVKQLVDINSSIKAVLALRSYEQKVNNIKVNTHLAPNLPEVMADSFQLQQVFLNIIVNAEYFMIEAHGRGTLTIVTEQVGDIIKASFADDGPGIAQENLGHLFDPFFTTKEVGKGTGLGLSICHGIVTEHSGRIYVESELGKGATFIVELPISK